LVGSRVKVAGWADNIRDHGGITFVDLRDRSGLLQVVVEIDNGELSRLTRSLKHESVVLFEGDLKLRPEERVNKILSTGLWELKADTLEVLNRSGKIPFIPRDQEWGSEKQRLENRVIALRSAQIQENLLLRHHALKGFRDFLSDQGLLEIETPILTKSTPEGARDFLVPSRPRQGAFYALPQSPQLYKQLLIMGGLGGYFQVARCFRDEDLRADRQPEFTQLDLELGFVAEQNVTDLVENMVQSTLSRLGALGLLSSERLVTVAPVFPRISYDEAMARYASDAPDLRFGLPIVDLTDIASASEVKVFRQVADQGGVVRAINAKGAGNRPDQFSKTQLDELIRFAQGYGAKGMAWIAIRDGGKVSSPIAKFFSEGQLQSLLERTEAAEGDIIFFVADKEEAALRVLNPVRKELGKRLDLIDPYQLAFAWVEDFPLFEYSAEDKRLVAKHHPFTSPNQESLDLLLALASEGRLEDHIPELLRIKARAYDLVLNGIELGGGSIRIHNPALQKSMLKIIGIDDARAEDSFGFLLRALDFGAPPHGGLAIGVDRFIMLLANAASLREVIAFPKLGDASDPLTGAPDYVDPAQLKELGFEVEEI
jgi:aspartyl-tRNA synthetase